MYQIRNRITIVSVHMVLRSVFCEAKQFERTVPMKIAIVGYSGSGKSTLASKLAAKQGTSLLHFDTVQFLPGWEERPFDEKLKMTEEFLDNNSSWVIDGNYFRLCLERRIAEADEVILLLFSRLTCLKRAFSRYLKYKNTTRPDMAEGCNEKFDLEFAQWILFNGRSKDRRAKYEHIIKSCGEKAVVIKNPKQLDAYMKARGIQQ